MAFDDTPHFRLACCDCIVAQFVSKLLPFAVHSLVLSLEQYKKLFDIHATLPSLVVEFSHCNCGKWLLPSSTRFASSKQCTGVPTVSVKSAEWNCQIIG
jgi:hypothetical protein